MRWFVWWSCWLLDGFFDYSFWGVGKRKTGGRSRGIGGPGGAYGEVADRDVLSMLKEKSCCVYPLGLVREIAVASLVKTMGEERSRYDNEREWVKRREYKHKLRFANCKDKVHR